MKAVGYPERRWDTFPVKKRGDLFNGTAAYFVPLCLSLVTRRKSLVHGQSWNVQILSVLRVHCGENPLQNWDNPGT